MALIVCKECGKEISDKANECPNCGCPLEQKQNSNVEDLKYSNQEQKNSNQICKSFCKLCLKEIGAMALFLLAIALYVVAAPLIIRDGVIAAIVFGFLLIIIIVVGIIYLVIRIFKLNKKRSLANKELENCQDVNDIKKNKTKNNITFIAVIVVFVMVFILPFRSVYKELHADRETGLLTTNKG